MSTITKSSPKGNLTKFLEKIPGIISWILILAPIWAAYLFPNEYGIILLCFIVFLVMKSIRNLVNFIISYLKIKKKSEADVFSEIKNNPDFAKLKHFVIIPFANEPISVLEPTILGLKLQNYDKNNIYICLTSEAKYPNGEIIANELISKYKNEFGGMYSSVHTLQLNEVVGKAANMLNGAKFCENIIENGEFDKDFITMTSCDCDSIFPSNYFALLAEKYLFEPDRYTIFWAGAMGYIANYWDLKYFSRILNSHFTYYNISLLERGWFRFVQVSTYSASYRLFKSIGFYSPDVVPEDFHTFFKALYMYGSKVRCEALNCVISSDASEGVGFVNTFVNQFKQVQRWAYGVSDHPYIIINTIKSWGNSKFTFYDKVYISFRSINVMIDMQLWPTYGFILGIGFYLVTILNPSLLNSAFWWRVPDLVSKLWIIGSMYYVVAYAISFKIRPPLDQEKFKGSYRQFYLIADTAIELIYWALFPIISFCLAILPGLVAHTRLMFGQYLEYWVTEKK